MSKIYLDTCIVIYFVEKHPDHADKIERLFTKLGVDDSLCYSPLVRLECLVRPLRTKDLDLKTNFEIFFDTQEMLQLAPECFDEAAQLRAESRALRTPDALHIATAHYHGCDEFWTNDNRLNAVAPSLVKNILVG